MPLANYIKKFDDGGEVEAEQEAPVSRETAPTAASKKQSPLAQQTNALAGNPEIAAQRDDRVRAFYEKQLADIGAKENNAFEQFGLNDIIARRSSPSQYAHAMKARSDELAARTAGKKEAIAGLNELDLSKASLANRSKVSDLIGQAAKETDPTKANALREQAASLDPTTYEAISNARKLETQPQSAAGKQAADEGYVRGTDAFAQRTKDIVQEKLTADQAKKGQLTDIQRVQVYDKIDELNGSIETTKNTLQQNKDYEANVKNLVKHKGLDAATGSVKGRTFSFTKEATNFENLLKSVQSQTFVSSVSALKGMGALSNAEGEKLASAQASLALTLSPDEMRKQLGIIQEIYSRGVKKQEQILASQERTRNSYQDILGGGKGAVAAPVSAAPVATPGAPAPGAAKPAQPALPAGTSKTINGVQYVFDGNGWKVA